MNTVASGSGGGAARGGTRFKYPVVPDPGYASGTAHAYYTFASNASVDITNLTTDSSDCTASGTNIFATPGRQGAGDYAINTLAGGLSAIATITPTTKSLTTSLTIAFWYLPAASGGERSDGRIFDSTSTDYFSINTQSDNTIYLFTNGVYPSQYYTNLITGLTANVWVHVAIVLDRSATTDIYAYKNGVLVTTLLDKANVGTATLGNSFIGGRVGGAGDYQCRGTVDNFRWHKEALTADQIYAIYYYQT